MAPGHPIEPSTPGEADPTHVGSPAARRRGADASQSGIRSRPERALGTGTPVIPAGREGDQAPDAANAQTVQIRTRRESGSASAMGTVGRTASSPLEALFLEEVSRTRAFVLFCIFIDILGLIGLPFVGGNRIVRDILMVELVVNTAAALYEFHHLRDPARYRASLIVTLAVLASITGYTAVLYWGINSAAPCMVVLGIYFFSRGQSLAAAILIYGLCAGQQAILAALILSGAVPDPGIYTGAGLPLAMHLVTQVLLQFIFFAAYVLARQGRASTLRVIDDLLQAHRQAEQREAAFQEVRQQLDRVLQLGGPGRHTDRVLSNYRLGVVVGRGAMGEVYEAVHVESGERAAVKLLHPNVMAHAGSIQRFLREATAAGALESPHVVRILEASPPNSGLPYLVMEYLTGHDLAHHLRKRRRLPREKLEQLLRQVGSAIDEAGEKGIVHRDIKPQNLFLHQRHAGPGVWKVLDFGASKLAQHKGTLTEGRVVGTPAYMAPEQARGEDVSPSADVYALAAISYRCLCGRPPFSGKDLPTTLYNVCYSMPPQPSLVADLPVAVDSVLAVGLAKNPGERFESAHELAEALTQALAGTRDDWIDRRAEALLAILPWGSTP